MDEYMKANRGHWNECVPIHVASEMYDVPAFKAGRSTLNQTELEELGEVRGKTLLHLQCHFGLDTLSWAREGAIVTGVDFSEPAIETAHGLAAALGIEARFLMSNIYDLPANLDGQFDIVFTSYGVLIWLPDVTRWAEIAASFVRPGGTFYIAEFHPFAGVFDGAKDVDDLRVRNPYFPTEKPLRFEDIGTYTDRGGKLQNSVTYEWAHPVSDVVTALVDAGLRIEFFHEFPYTPWSYLPFKEHAGDGMFRLAKHDGCVPLVYSIKATKPETS